VSVFAAVTEVVLYSIVAFKIKTLTFHKVGLHVV